MQLNVLNDLVKAKRRWTEKKSQGSAVLGTPVGCRCQLFRLRRTWPREPPSFDQRPSQNSLWSHPRDHTRNTASRIQLKKCDATQRLASLFTGFPGPVVFVRTSTRLSLSQTPWVQAFQVRYMSATSRGCAEEARTCEAWFQLTFRPQKWNLKAHMWYQLFPFPSSNVAICDAATPRQHSPILRYSALLRYSVLCFNSITQCNWHDIETMAE